MILFLLGVLYGFGLGALLVLVLGALARLRQLDKARKG